MTTGNGSVVISCCDCLERNPLFCGLDTVFSTRFPVVRRVANLLNLPSAYMQMMTRTTMMTGMPLLFARTAAPRKNFEQGWTGQTAGGKEEEGNQVRACR
jgi:hypothetical protein